MQGIINTKQPKKELITVAIVIVVMAFMELTGLPSALFLNVQIADISPVYFSLMLNFVIAGILCYVLMKIFCPQWRFGLRQRGFWYGLKRYGFVGFIVVIITFFALIIGLQPFDTQPSIGKVLIEGFIYYIGLGIIEEIYLRGLLLNLIEKLFGERKNAVVWAVIISSVIFGVGHIFGEIGNAPLQMISKVVWTICLGIYFGAIYKTSGNLWVPIVLHTLINFAAVPFCYSSSSDFPTVILFIFLISYVLLGVYGIYILTKKQDGKSICHK